MLENLQDPHSDKCNKELNELLNSNKPQPTNDVQMVTSGERINSIRHLEKDEISKRFKRSEELLMFIESTKSSNDVNVTGLTTHSLITEVLINNVENWARDKGLIKPENAYGQLLKTMEEIGELAGAILRTDQEGMKDGIGDAFVTLIILANQLGFTPQQCLSHAWDEIKGRTGKTVNGTFVKDSDLQE